jgi:hypothetical protein
MATKSKRVSVGKRELEETAVVVETVAVVQAEGGMVQAAEGVTKLQAAREVGGESWPQEPVT